MGVTFKSSLDETWTIIQTVLLCYRWKFNFYIVTHVGNLIPVPRFTIRVGICFLQTLEYLTFISLTEVKYENLLTQRVVEGEQIFIFHYCKGN